MMSTFKLSLFAVAALMLVTAGARAEDLEDLKGHIEALDARIAQLQTSPALPAGYQLLTVSQADAMSVPSLELDKHYTEKATALSIAPTAGGPPTTFVYWSGFARAAMVYRTDKFDYSALIAPFQTINPTLLASGSHDIDIYSRGEIRVVGGTSTAVGEVGGLVRLQGNLEGRGDTNVTIPEAWGWWKMTPELTVGGGYTSTLANIGYGYDGACTCYYTDTAPMALPGGQEKSQLRLSYASGPLSFAVALEDATQFIYVGRPFLYDPLPPFDILGAEILQVGRDGVGVAGEIKYAGQNFSAEVSAGWWDTSGVTIYSKLYPPLLSTVDTFQVGAGIGVSFGDMASISLAAGLGKLATGSDYWKASVLTSAKLNDSIHAEVAYGHADFSGGTRGTDAGGTITAAYANSTNAALAGIYYDPVPQLTVGLEAEWSRTKYSGLLVVPVGTIGSETVKQTSTQIDLITVYRF
jgi:hypothetical protein